MATRRSLFVLTLDAAADVGLLGAISSLDPSGNTEQRMIVSSLTETARDAYTAGLLIRQHSFYTVSGTADYALPSDYYLPVIQTQWNSTDQWPIRNIGQSEWQANKSGFTASSVHQRYRVMPAFYSGANSDQHSLRRMHIDPTPTAAEKIVFNYRSDHWVDDLTTQDTIDDITLSGTSEVSITAASHGRVGGDVVHIYGVVGTTELNGNSYTISSTTTDAFTLLGTSSADFTAYSSAGTFYPLSETTGNGLFTYSLLPEDLMERGIVYRLRRRMGMSYFEHKEEYDQILEAHRGAAHGDHVISLSKSSGSRYVGIPEGNFTQS